MSEVCCNFLMHHPPFSNFEMKLNIYFLGPGEALDQETWLKILQRQEAVHQLELQKWHDLLGNAATLLKQVILSML